MLILYIIEYTAVYVWGYKTNNMEGALYTLIGLSFIWVLNILNDISKTMERR